MRWMWRSLGVFCDSVDLDKSTPLEKNEPLTLSAAVPFRSLDLYLNPLGYWALKGKPSCLVEVTLQTKLESEWESISWHRLSSRVVMRALQFEGWRIAAAEIPQSAQCQ